MECKENFEKQDVLINGLVANLSVFPILIISGFSLSVPFIFIWGMDKLFEGLGNFFSLYVFLPVFIGGILFHEFLHAFGWVNFGCKDWKSIKFGFSLKALSPYTHCKQPLKIGAYRIGSIIPGLITGFLPGILGLILGNGLLLISGIFFITAAGGDIIVLLYLRKFGNDYLVQDHPTKIGCIVYHDIK